MRNVVDFLAGVLFVILMGLFVVLCGLGSGYHWE